ncbi:uncharacterized protein LOC122512805 [Leptopilina heterotoma]|uniref:uncharacterized protein LOC122512805 n=1 Tax=Leptopilina heterotoma TaxID=63436 RepID=UPI001CA9A06B|nr:uncharacterized protein LOC122512805 [Leptopilina heterotoma]
MKRVLIICLLIALIKSEDEYTDENIMFLKGSLLNSSIYMKEHSVKDNAAIFVGGGKVGKSTLLNYLIGNELKAISERGRPISLRRADNTSEGPIIGGGSVSNTTVPRKYNSKEFANLSLWDTPGFSDNRGEIQDIINAFYIYQLIKNVDYLKVVLLFEYSELVNNSINIFIQVINSLETLLGSEYQDFFESVTVIFSKVSPDEDDDYFGFIDYFITSQVLPQKSILHLNNFTVNFLEFLKDHRDHIGFFKRANRDGPVNSSDIDVNIISAIKKSSRVIGSCLLDLHPSISALSKNWLYKAANILQSQVEYINLLNNTKPYIENLSKKISELAKNRNLVELRAIKRSLRNVISIFNRIYKTTDFEETIKLYKTVDDSIKEIIDSNKLLLKIDLLLFVDKLLERETNKQILMSLHTILLPTQDVLNNCICQIENFLGETERRNCIDELDISKARTKRSLDEKKNEIEALNNKSTINNLWGIVKQITDDINQLELTL